MRYFARISYNGAQFHGWQSQKTTASTAQEAIEKTLSLLSRESISIVGCGRTDAGVHAINYIFHFDSEFDFVGREYKLNSILGKSIVIYSVFPIHENAHARYDAERRTYTYYLHTAKNPFYHELSFHYRGKIPSIRTLQDAADLLVGSKSYVSLCKTGSDVSNYNCMVDLAEWKQVSESQYTFTIASNRFLRGMVRLCVGMCLNVLENKVSLEEASHALENAAPMPKNYSVPAHGLFLEKIEYPYPTH